MNSDLAIFVLNSLLGESILIRFDDQHYGIIDMYDASRRDHLGSIIPESARIEFLALTHPHLDHFKGMAAFIRENHDRIERFWRFPGTGSREIMARYLSRVESQKGPKYDDYARIAKREFEQLIDALVEHGPAWGNRYMRLSDPRLVLLYEGFGCKVWGIAPLEPIVSEYEDFLKDPKAPFQEQLGRNENIVSCFFMLEYAGRYFLFLSDIVHPDAWNNIHECLQEAGIDPEDVVYAKCSHHGSDTGFHKALFDWLSPLEHISITSFSRSSLPREEWVREYQGHAASMTLVSGYYAKPNRTAKQYDLIQQTGSDCDRIQVDGQGKLRAEHIKV